MGVRGEGESGSEPGARVSAPGIARRIEGRSGARARVCWALLVEAEVAAVWTAQEQQQDREQEQLQLLQQQQQQQQLALKRCLPCHPCHSAAVREVLRHQ